MVRLTKKEKKDLFIKCFNKAKNTGKTGEELTDEAWALINDQYDRWDWLNGMDFQEQVDWDECWDKWVAEVNI